LIQRDIFPQIRKHLSEPEITLVIGPRQAGKTTILKVLYDELIANKEKCLFFNLDISSDFRYFDTQDDLLYKIKNEVGIQKAYLFIDEVQRIENAGLFLKGLYDRALPYKWIVTGSGSLELKENIAESLVGRKRNFNVPTISIHEFCEYKTDYKYSTHLPDVLVSEETLEEHPGYQSILFHLSSNYLQWIISRDILY